MGSDSIKTVRGVVDRISGSGNAMLQTSHGEENLGPLPPSIVGQKVTALNLAGTWALCLDPEYLERDYVVSLLNKGAVSSYFTESERTDLDDEDMDSIFSKLLSGVDLRSSAPPSFSVGDKIKVNFLNSISQGKWVANHQATIVHVDTPFAAMGLTMNVSVTDVKDAYITAEISPAVEPQKKVSTGDEIRIEPKAHDGEDTYAVIDDIPVCIPGERYPIGADVTVGVETVSNLHIVASFSAVDRDHLPEKGSIISLNKTPENGISIIDGIPYDIELPLFDTGSSSDIFVSDITSVAVEAVCNIEETVSIDSDDILAVEVEQVDDERVIGRYQDMAVVLPHEGQLSSALREEIVAVQVEEVLPDRANVSLAAPSSSNVEIGEDHGITVLGRSSDYAIAIVEQTPIVVESSHLLQGGDELRIRLTEVHQGCIEGSVAALPDCPSEGEAIRFSSPGSSAYTLFNGIPVTVPEHLSIETEVCLGVEAVNSDGVLATVHGLPPSDPPDAGENIVASIVQPTSSGTFAVSDGIPILLPIYGISNGTEVMVKVTRVEAAYIQGFIVSVETDSSVVEFSDYQGYVQLGTTDIRRESFADAAVHFNAAAGIGAEVSGTTAALPKYAGTLSVVINLIRSGDIANAENAVEDAIEMLLEDIEGEEKQMPMELCRLRLQAVGLLLEAIQGVSDEDNSNPLQHIYQESVARLPLREATQLLQEAQTVVQGTPYEETVPGMLLERVLWLVDDEFSSSVHDLSGWTPKSPPDMGDFTWPYQFLEDAPSTEDGVSLSSDMVEEQVELSSFDVDTGIAEGDLPAGEPVELESEDSEWVDADSGTATETWNTADANSEVSVGSLQPSDEGPPASDEEEGRNEVEDTVVQTETVEESQSASISDTSSPEIGENSAAKESAAAEDSPLKVVTEAETAEVDADLSELRTKAEERASSDPVRDTSPEITTVGSRYQRAPAIRDYALARADGVCECCGGPAPFKKPAGEPYLEVHHVDELGEGGEDHPDKVVALCPVCHKRIHYGEDGSSINNQLAEKLEAGLADVGVE
jgi:5-methylcytosine-specific restriction endonuclease McrA